MLISGNKWKFFKKLDRIFGKIIDDNAKKLLSDKKDLKKYERKIFFKVKKADEIEDYLQNTSEYLKDIDPTYFRAIPSILALEIDLISREISINQTLIRTIRAKYKKKDAFSKVKERLNSLKDKCHSLLEALVEKWRPYITSKIEKVLANNSFSIDTFHLHSIPGFLDKPQIWYDLHYLKKTQCSFDNSQASDFKWLSSGAYKEFKVFTGIIEKIIQKTKGSTFHLVDIYSSENLQQLETMKNPRFRLELIYHFFQLGIIKESQDYFNSEVHTQIETYAEEKMAKAIEHILSEDITKPDLLISPKSPNKSKSIPSSESKIGSASHSEIFSDLNIKGMQLDSGISLSEDPLTYLEMILIDAIQKKKEQYIEDTSGDLVKSADKLEKHESEFLGYIEAIENWIHQYIRPFIQSSYSDLLNQFQITIKSLKENILREIEDFESYAENVRAESHRSQLNKQINEKVSKLQDLVQSYQEQTFEIAQTHFPQIDELKSLLHTYRKDFEGIQSEVSDIFQTYEKDKNINIHENFKYWQESYDRLVQQTNFFITKAMNNLINEFTDIIEKENDFFQGISPLNFNLISMENIQAVEEEEDKRSAGSNKPKKDAETEIDSLSNQDKSEIDQIDKKQEKKSLKVTSFLLPENLTVHQIKQYIGKINKKMDKLGDLRQNFRKQKQYYQKMLRKKLKDKHEIVSKKCAICHKMVDVSEDHYIVCEFCQAMYHYTCSANWIEKYNSCPVCNNSYTKPHSHMFNPEETS